jgi:hypothetical protein
MDVYRGKDLMPTTRKHKECKVQNNHATDYFKKENMNMPQTQKFSFEKQINFGSLQKLYQKEGTK